MPRDEQAAVARLSTGRQAVGLAFWLAITFAAAALGAVASVNAASFYGRLAQPGWAPPASAFGPVWSMLYTLIGVAAWRVWRVHGLVRARGALLLFVVQLAANALWTWLFFAWRQGGLALAEMALLWLLIVATVLAFGRFDRLAAALLLPYLAWVSFAAALTWTLWRLNPGLLA